MAIGNLLEKVSLLFYYLGGDREESFTTFFYYLGGDREATEVALDASSPPLRPASRKCSRPPLDVQNQNRSKEMSAVIRTRPGHVVEPAKHQLEPLQVVRLVTPKSSPNSGN
jgi:hypothetical protein